MTLDQTFCDSDRKIPAHEITYGRLRDMILFGQLAPGQPVTIQGLAASLETGMTPVREAIRRLTAEGALELRGNRRVTVPTLSPGELDELAFARTAIEPRLAELAAERLDRGQIREIEAIDAAINLAIDRGDVHAYLLNNYRFHFAIYAQAQAPILLSIAQSLWLRCGPSLRIVCGRYGTSNLPDRHHEALDAMRDRDAAALARALREDICQGIAQIRAGIAAA